MSTLLDLPIAVQPRDLQRCCERELAYRRRVYPRLIAKGSMTEHKAQREIELMEACVAHFRALVEAA
jgi:hypothetical protein